MLQTTRPPLTGLTQAYLEEILQVPRPTFLLDHTGAGGKMISLLQREFAYESYTSLTQFTRMLQQRQVRQAPGHFLRFPANITESDVQLLEDYLSFALDTHIILYFNLQTFTRWEQFAKRWTERYARSQRSE